MCKIVTELKKVRNGGMAETMEMILAAAAGHATKCGGLIKVQPTGVSRRSQGITRGNTTMPAGCPPKQPATKRTRKQPHSLKLRKLKIYLVQNRTIRGQVQQNGDISAVVA